MKPVPVRVAGPALLLYTLLIGCAGRSSPPIRTALVDVTGESRSIKVYSRSWPFSPIAVHRQALSIGGLLNIPDIGMQLNFPGANDITTATGIAVVQSYRLIGEANVPKGWSRVTEVRDALELVQDLSLELSLLAPVISRARDAYLETKDPLLREEFKSRLKTRDELEQAHRKARARLRKLANTPGIVIARWRSGERGGASAELGSIASAGGAFADFRGGFVILGGLRVVSAVFGEDFWWLLNNLRQHEKKHIGDIGIVTQLIQARDVAYTSALSTEQKVAIKAAFDEAAVDRIESIRVEGYWLFLGQYSNSGNLPRIKWKREPFCAVCSLDLPGLAPKKDRELQKLFHVEEEEVDPASYQHWRTISANITFLRDVPFFSWPGFAAKYAKSRKMYASPSCQFCGKLKYPVYVEGWCEHGRVACDECERRGGLQSAGTTGFENQRSPREGQSRR